MKIALLGAPGAGKSLIARRLCRRLGKQWTVIDGYVDKLTARTGISFGPDQTVWAFRHNLQVWGERWTLEDEAMHRGQSTITCGSIFESIVYAAAQGIAIPGLGNEQLMVDETYVNRVMMEALGILTIRTFDYDALFYLPLSEMNEDWEGVVDAKLPEVLEGQNKIAVPLTGTDKQRVDRAEQVINVITSTTDDQSAV